MIDDEILTKASCIVPDSSRVYDELLDFVKTKWPSVPSETRVLYLQPHIQSTQELRKRKFRNRINRLLQLLQINMPINLQYKTLSQIYPIPLITIIGVVTLKVYSRN
jgi:hypothetical protein